MDFGTRLKNLRKNLEISQEEFANKLGISRSAVGNYEVNQNMPTADVFNKMSDILGCSVDYLLGKTDSITGSAINLDDIDISFLTGVKGLNETNKMIIKNTIDALLTKQKIDENKKEEK